MIVLLDLPPELLLMIISRLKVVPTAFQESRRRLNQQAILPLSRTSKALWKLARPFLYHDIEIIIVPPKLTAELYQLKLQTSLLYRSLLENPSLLANVQTLKVKGLVYYHYLYIGDIPNERHAPSRHQPSSVFLKAAELDRILSSCINTRRFKIFSTHGLPQDIKHQSNQIILSCLRAMSKLETLEIVVGRHRMEDYANPVIHFLNDAPKTLKVLNIEPFRFYYTPKDFEEYPEYNGPAPIPRSDLISLRLPAERLPLRDFLPWLNRVQSLTVSDLMLLNGQTNQGPNIRSILAPLSSTLRELALWLNFNGDAPNLSDLAMPNFPVLDFFTYGGPWCFGPDDQPYDICQSLFSRSYRFLNIHMGTGLHGPRMQISPLLQLREAFFLARQLGCSPEQCRFTFDLKYTAFVTYDDSFKKSFKGTYINLMQELSDHGFPLHRWHCDCDMPEEEQMDAFSNVSTPVRFEASTSI